MKRTGNIYQNICKIDNIKMAILKASLGKRHQSRVQIVLNDIDNYAMKIKGLLVSHRYTPSKYTIKKILDGSNNKERIICKPMFYPDQIIHWALILQIEPILSKGMYKYTCGSVPKRGTSYGQNILRKYLDKHPRKTRYCLKMDIHKFYPSINNTILKSMFRRKIKDKWCLFLIDKIISSYEGLPIGNYTSPWFSNFMLEGLDRFIKEVLKIKYYIRYVDDLVLLSSNKRKLHRSRILISKYLNNIGLTLKSTWSVSKVSKRPIDFLGFKFYTNKTILRKKNALRIKRRVQKIFKKNFLNHRDASAIISFWGWIKRSNSYNFYIKNIRHYIDIKDARKVVSDYAKRIRVCDDSRVQSRDSIC